MARATISQAVQVGVETTLGTAVAANKLLQALSIEPGPNIEVNSFRPRGYKYPTITAIGKDYTTANLAGVLTFNEIVYPFSSVLEKITPSQQGSSNAYLWRFRPKYAQADTVASFTVETGDQNVAERAAGMVVNEFGLSFTRDNVEVNGSMFGQKYETGITLTASPTAIDLVPVLPSQVCVYVDDTLANIGTTQITGAIQAEWNIANRFGMFWPLDCNASSWTELLEDEVNFTVKLTMDANSTAMGYLSNMRNGDVKYVRIEAVGGIADATYNYRLTLDMKGAFNSVDPLKDQDGVMAIGYEFVGIPETTTWNSPMNVEVVNLLSSL